MDKYYKWDGTAQGVEGLELFLGQKVQFNPESGRIRFSIADVQYQVNIGDTVIVLAEGDVILVGGDANVDVAIAQHRAARDVPPMPALNADAPPADGGSVFTPGTFEWALVELSKGSAIRCTAWKPGRVLTPTEADTGTWELA